VALFKLQFRLPSRTLDRLAHELSDSQFSDLITGDCWLLDNECVCRSLERFELYRIGLATIHGRLTDDGLRLQRSFDG
jgi:hypothetical protein